ncbi:hypothetical protein OG912_33860 [Streptomyces sp. NBC_00464]|uniref:hypothetical protein n=1 Tax=Streptomyces sp. NBC_00464 TaxID=2975751 RepID=UPI002E173BE9
MAVIGGVAAFAAAVTAAVVTGLFQPDGSNKASPGPAAASPSAQVPTTPTPSPAGATSAPPSEASVSPVAESPLPAYAIKADRVAISLPKPDTYAPGKLDIDRIRASRGGKDGAELVYDSTWGQLKADNDAFVGKSSAQRPSSAEECIQDAERSAIGELDHSDLKPGDAFCIVSDDENVAWIRYVGKGSGSLPPLNFELTVWQMSQAQ